MTPHHRRAPKVSRALCALALCGLACVGCEHIPYKPGTPFSDQNLERNLYQEVRGMYPRSFRSVHRFIITVAFGQFNLTGYVLVRQPDDIRLVGLADTGGKLFDVVQRRGEKPRVLRNAIGLDEEWLTDGPFLDAVIMYLRGPSKSATLVQHGPNITGLVDHLSNGALQDYQFDANTGRLMREVIAFGDTCAREMTFSEYGTFPDWSPPTPRHIEIKNHEWDYRLVIQVLKLEPSELTDAMFEPEP